MHRGLCFYGGAGNPFIGCDGSIGHLFPSLSQLALAGLAAFGNGVVRLFGGFCGLLQIGIAGNSKRLHGLAHAVNAACGPV